MAHPAHEPRFFRLSHLSRAGILCCTLGLVFQTTPALAARLLIAGYGPELPVIQDLATTYERNHPGTVIDIEWDRTVRAVQRVEAGAAQIAVTDHPEAPLQSTQIAWEGIAMIVNFANPVRNVSRDQLTKIVTGALTTWADLDGAATHVDLIPRTVTTNLTTGLYQSLGLIAPPPSNSVGAVRPDDTVLRMVAGQDAAISYLALPVALQAQADGLSLRILTIDHVEGGESTVINRQYPLRRPVFMLTAPSPNPLTESFLAFVGSPAGHAVLRSLLLPMEAPR